MAKKANEACSGIEPYKMAYDVQDSAGRKGSNYAADSNLYGGCNASISHTSWNVAGDHHLLVRLPRSAWDKLPYDDTDSGRIKVDLEKGCTRDLGGAYKNEDLLTGNTQPTSIIRIHRRNIYAGGIGNKAVNQTTASSENDRLFQPLHLEQMHEYGHIHGARTPRTDN
ncbi:hypothetical protein FISHEDRAFT_55197 [Fistulina hepatica ATCC 64428]|uniref:Uncharacterized protein n=1 Tax=Fistulina hepatica ATCC 64428 TaxID=1128425 RepID=A0A0D7ARM5_9AGAR|nr:hypothetical protein FISHEDRAFT_55197 [Fistulina hepatica ATCC 64428]